MRSAATGSRRRAVDAVARLAGDAELRAAHREMLPPPRRRARGEVDVQLATARAKLETFEMLDDAALLTPKEKMAVLGDAATLDRLLALPSPRKIARPV
jgi:membrane glycosyltransferase